MRNCSEEDRSGGSEKSKGERGGYTVATTFVHIVCKSSNARIIHIADSGERTYVSRRFHARTPKQIASYIITREKRTRANAGSIPQGVFIIGSDTFIRKDKVVACTDTSWYAIFPYSRLTIATLASRA